MENESPATNENINQEPITDSKTDNPEPETAKTDTTGDNDSSSIQPQSESNNKETAIVNNGELLDDSSEKIEKTIADEPVNTTPDNFQQQTPGEPQPQITYQAPIYQQAPGPQSSASVPEPKKKKFPWFFTVLWLIMLAAVGIWGYFLLIDPNYNYPVFTPEAQRYVIFTAAVAVLIYTLSLKLAIKKLKAIPAILMVVFGLVIFVLFCMIELQEGNFLHDMVSDLVESVIPAFGE
jgi:hypothetical protein